MSQDSTAAPGMHPYGQQAWDHWRIWRPNELSQIPDRMARSTAESQVLRELVLLPPEPGHPQYDPEDDPDRQATRYPAEAPWEPLEGVSPGDPGYHRLDSDPFLSPMPNAPEAPNAPRP